MLFLQQLKLLVQLSQQAMTVEHTRIAITFDQNVITVLKGAVLISYSIPTYSTM
jgi:hypothetical protein